MMTLFISYFYFFPFERGLFYFCFVITDAPAVGAPESLAGQLEFMLFKLHIAYVAFFHLSILTDFLQDGHPPVCAVT